MWRKGNLNTILGIQTSATTMEKVTEVLKKLKIKLMDDPTIGIYLKETKTVI